MARRRGEGDSRGMADEGKKSEPETNVQLQLSVTAGPPPAVAPAPEKPAKTPWLTPVTAPILVAILALIAPVTTAVNAHFQVLVQAIVAPTPVQAEVETTGSQADFGVVHQPTDNPHLNGDVICEAEGICVLPRRHPLADHRQPWRRAERVAPRLTLH